MTLKFKIITGFALMFVIMAALSITGYRTVNQSTATLEDYNRVAARNAMLSEAQADINGASAELEKYLRTNAADAIDKCPEQEKEALGLAQMAHNLKALMEKPQ